MWRTRPVARPRPRRPHRSAGSVDRGPPAGDRDPFRRHADLEARDGADEEGRAGTVRSRRGRWLARGGAGSGDLRSRRRGLHRRCAGRCGGGDSRGRYGRARPARGRRLDRRLARGRNGRRPGARLLARRTGGAFRRRSIQGTGRASAVRIAALGRQLDARPRHGRLAAGERAGDPGARESRCQRDRRRDIDGPRLGRRGRRSGRSRDRRPLVPPRSRRLGHGQTAHARSAGRRDQQRRRRDLLAASSGPDGGAGRRPTSPLRRAVRDAARNRAGTDRRSVRVPTQRRRRGRVR